MGFIDTLSRIPKILESNINAMLNKAEDPAKMIDQTLVDYKRNLADVKRDLVEVMANLEVAKKELDEATDKVNKYSAAAKKAVEVGNTDDARTLLTSKQAAEVSRASLQKNYDMCLQNCNTMKAGYNKLVADIENLEMRKDAAKAKISMAKAQETINTTNSIASTSKVVDSFAKYEAMANKALAKANASAELDAQVETAETIAAKYDISSADASVEAELAALMAECSK